jgi:hypothetical protein
MSDDIEFEDMNWGSLTKQLKAFNSKNKKKFNLKQFSNFILNNPSKFQKKTQQRANFYLNVILPKKGGGTGASVVQPENPDYNLKNMIEHYLGSVLTDEQKSQLDNLLDNTVLSYDELFQVDVALQDYINMYGLHRNVDYTNFVTDMLQNVQQGNPIDETIFAQYAPTVEAPTVDAPTVEDEEEYEPDDDYDSSEDQDYFKTFSDSSSGSSSSAGRRGGGTGASVPVPVATPTVQPTTEQIYELSDLLGEVGLPEERRDGIIQAYRYGVDYPTFIQNGGLDRLRSMIYNTNFGSGELQKIPDEQVIQDMMFDIATSGTTQADLIPREEDFDVYDAEANRLSPSERRRVLLEAAEVNNPSPRVAENTQLDEWDSDFDSELDDEVPDWVLRASDNSDNSVSSYEQDRLSDFDNPSAGKRGGKLAAHDMSDLLAASYDKKIHDVGDFKIDRQLSGQRAQVYYNPKTGQAVVVHRGTAGMHDWITDARMLFGDKKSKRFKHGEKVQKEAEQKYGKNIVTTIGHSLGSSIAERVGQDSHEVLTLNKPVTPKDLIKGKKVSDKQYDVRTAYDPVSILRPHQGGKEEQTIESITFNPLAEHKTDTLKRLDEDTLIGRGRMSSMMHKRGGSYFSSSPDVHYRIP